jgi:DNA-binding LacI/PurR family transcriptional regulator
MQRLLQNKIRLTAVFTANDLMAKGAIGALRDQGLQVPKDVSVVGFDDINIASQMNPPLTTVKQPIFRLGEEAALFLIDHEEGQRNDFSKILPTELIVRESCSHLWNF